MDTLREWVRQYNLRLCFSLISSLIFLFFVGCVHMSEPSPEVITLDAMTSSVTPVIATTTPVSSTSSISMPADTSDLAASPTISPTLSPLVTTFGEDLSIEYITSTEGSASVVYSQDGYVYAGIGEELVIFHQEDEYPPTPVGRMQLLSTVQDIEVAGDYAYLALGEQGLGVIDVSEISNLRQIGNYAVPGFSNALDLHREYVYLATENSGMWVIDVSVPVTPNAAGSFEFPTQVKDIIVTDDDIGYVATSAWNGEAYVGQSGVYMLDISQPETIREIDFFDTGDEPAKRLRIAGDYLYVVTGFDVVPWVGNGLRILDLKSMAEIEGYINLGNFVVSSVSIEDTYIYIITQLCRYMTTGECGGWLTVLDISDISSPIEYGGPVPCSDCGFYGLARDITVMGDYVYIATEHEGLRICKVLTPK